MLRHATKVRSSSCGCRPAKQASAWIVGSRLKTHLSAIDAENSGVDVNSRPAIAVVVNELPYHLLVDPHAQGDGAMYAPTFVSVIDASMDHESLPQRHIGKGHPDRIGASGMLPNTSSWLELKVLQNGGTDPEPGTRGITDERFRRGHRTMTKATWRRARTLPGAVPESIVVDELNASVRNLLDEVIDHLVGRYEPHAHADTVEILLDRRRLVARARAANGDLPYTIDPREIAWSGPAQR